MAVSIACVGSGNSQGLGYGTIPAPSTGTTCGRGTKSTTSCQCESLRRSSWKIMMSSSQPARSCLCGGTYEPFTIWVSSCAACTFAISCRSSMISASHGPCPIQSYHHWMRLLMTLLHPGEMPLQVVPRVMDGDVNTASRYTGKNLTFPPGSSISAGRSAVTVNVWGRVMNNMPVYLPLLPLPTKIAQVGRSHTTYLNASLGEAG